MFKNLIKNNLFPKNPNDLEYGLENENKNKMYECNKHNPITHNPITHNPITHNLEMCDYDNVNKIIEENNKIIKNIRSYKIY
jgi:hypothetical protein